MTLVNQIWHVITQIFSIVGGLGVFIFGMKVLSDGLQKAAGSRMQGLLDRMTGRPISAIGTGVAVTSLLQSSSATTVMVVSVVNAGLLGLTGAIGVIMGANIGTTLTAWIVSALGFKVSVSSFALPVIAIGFPMLLNSKSKHKGLAEALVGFGILFLGLGFLKEYLATDEMKNIIQTAISAVNLDFYLLKFPVFVLIGTILTVLVQSSSAAMTITLTLISIGALTFEQGALIVLGENIGTTITAYLASLGANVNAKRASRVHILFNLIGVAWMFVAFNGFTWIVRRIIPDGTVLFGNENYLQFQLSMFHTLFNITNTFLLMWFIPQLERAAKFLVKDQMVADGNSLKLFNSGFQQVTEGYLYEAREYLRKLYDKVGQMLSNVGDQFGETSVVAGEFYQQQVQLEADIDVLEDELADFLSELSTRELSDDHHAEVSVMIRAVGELERAGDEILRMSKAWKKMAKRNIDVESRQQKDFTDIFAKLKSLHELSAKVLIDRDVTFVESGASALSDELMDINKKQTKQVRKRLESGANIRLEMMYIEILNAVNEIRDLFLTTLQFDAEKFSGTQAD